MATSTQPARADVFYLEDGEIVVGTLVGQGPAFFEVRPAGSNHTQLVSRSEVVRIEQAGSSSAAEQQAAEDARARAEAAAWWKARQEEEKAERQRKLAEPRYEVTLHLEGSPDAEVRRSEGVDGVGTLCRAPCGETLSIRPSDELEVDGAGITSAPFPLIATSGEARYRVDAGSAGMKALGIVGLSIGGAGVLGGALALASSRAQPPDTQGPMQIGGGVALGVGAAVAGTGLALMLTLGRTKVQWLPPSGDHALRVELDVSGGTPTLRF